MRMEKRGSLTTVYSGANHTHKTGSSTWRWGPPVLEKSSVAPGGYFINKVSKALLEKAILTSKKSYKILST